MALLRSFTSSPLSGGLLDDIFDNSQFGLPLLSLHHGQGKQHGEVHRSQGATTSGIPVDVAEMADHFEVHANVPGVSKEHIKLDVDGDLLRVSCETVEEHVNQPSDSKPSEQNNQKQDAGVTWHRVERHSQFSSRTLRMPDSADLGQVSAKLEDGVLRVHIPKKVEATAKQRRVAIE
mmetsp:Transcript_44591/g.83248  ORF Transcript_44591/g.83248 Transcript_44591/m.83248 type:complete len:177 (-) Transcript_44591:275-805(-)